MKINMRAPLIQTSLPHHSKKHPLRVFLMGILIISMVSTTFGFFNWISLTWIIELSLTAFCVLFCYTCVIHVYQEHASNFHQEALLKERIIALLEKQYGFSAPTEKIILLLEQILDYRSSPDARIETLQLLKSDPVMREALIEQLKQQEQHLSVFKDLGLSWEKN